MLAGLPVCHSRRLAECRTHDTPLPGAWGVGEARERLKELGQLSPESIARLTAIYGGRAAGIANLIVSEPKLARCIDPQETITAAEVVFVVREEMPRTLVDIVYRRMMIGLDADQGRSMYEQLAEIAAAEFGWSDDEMQAQLRALIDYSDSFRV